LPLFLQISTPTSRIWDVLKIFQPFYAAIFPLVTRITSVKSPGTAKFRKEDYGGRKFHPEELEKLLKEAPFASVKVHTKLTHMYAVCKK